MLALVGLVACVVWAPSIANDFVWDDINVIVSSDRLQAPGAWWHVMTHPAMWVTGLETGGVATWRPLALASFAVEYLLWGLEPAGYHVGSIALHAMVAMLFAAWLRRIGLSMATAMIAAIVFAVHPAHVESVAWINGRSELIALLGGLVALHGAVGPRPRLALVVFGVLLAGLGKETGIIFAPGAVLAAWATRCDSRGVARVGLAALVGAAVWWGLRAMAIGSGGGGVDASSLFAAIARWPLLVGVVLEATFVPLRRGIAVVGTDLADAPLWMGLAGWAVVAAVFVGAAVLARRGERGVIVGVAWFFAALAPLVAIVFTGWPGLNRWLYVGVPGLVVAVVIGVRAWRPELATPARRVAVVLAVALAALSFNAQSAWRTELSLYRVTVAEAPEQARGWFMLGLALAREGDDVAAAEALERGLDRGDAIGGVHSVLAVVYTNLGRCDEAHAAFANYDGLVDRDRLVTHLATCSERAAAPPDASGPKP